MNAKKIAIVLLILGAWSTLISDASGAVVEKPAWLASATSLPTNFAPGSKGEILLLATNVGGAPTSEPISISDTLPVGLTPLPSSFGRSSDPAAPSPSCNVSGQTIVCAEASPIGPGRHLEIVIVVNTALMPQSLLDKATIEGGGAVTATTALTATISSSPAAFGFLPGFDAPLTEADGGVAAGAGSHPYQLTANLGFPTEKPAAHLGGAGHLRDVSVDFPRGEIVNPTATPVLCTEAELSSEIEPGCPDASQVGLVDVITSVATAEAHTSPLYNMVPPPGTAAEFGFDAIGVGVFVHISGGVRSDGDYGLSGGSDDILALTDHPVFGAQLQLWGDPSSPSYNKVRGKCTFSTAFESCPVDPTNIALLTAPGECPGQPIATIGHANSWEEPQTFHEASYESADLTGTPVEVTGCNKLEFDPTIEAQPTTNLVDSPSGLDFELNQPQTEVEGRSPAALKDATVTLPEGLVVNPSSANGQGACDSAQVGLITSVGQSPIHFSKDPATCPDAAKIGAVEAITPLLAEIDGSTSKVLRDAEGHIILRPLHGSVYLAKPFDNPFDSLLAVYLTIEDPRSGTMAKFAGRVYADPVTGQLSTIITESPQLPVEDIRLHLFGGARAPLRTPPACAPTPYTTTADLTPWSSPEGVDVHTGDSFAVTEAPGVAACPSSASTAPNQPSLAAGTVAPKAGAYSPFVLKVARRDGSQPLGRIEATLPPGVIAKLAGVPYCSEAEIAKAQGRSHPNEGALELADPSCPAASEVGTLDVAAGAGDIPLHTTGHAYLAGPYKGAPLSFVFVTPAVAGPFDLGAVVVRSAAYIDPERAQARAVSDPLPSILDGIPLDVRSVSVSLERPQFTLNPTNCQPMSINATITSLLGQGAALSTPFQVGGCSALAYKPKLSIRLRGQTKRAGHPTLTAVARFTAGQANTKRASVALPHSEFLDQEHIGTVCTRVQFAASTCPAASVYGQATATTPLLDQPLQGPVYLRSSSHELPDLVIALHGQVDVVLDGRVDSVNGGIRTTFEALPDAPASKLVLKMKGGRKGLLINSVNLCKLTPSATRATVKMDGQNGKLNDFNPVVRSDCAKPPKKSH